MFTVAVDAGYLWLVILALLTTVVGLYVYFRVIAKMFLGAPEEDASSLEPSTVLRLVIAVVVVSTIFFGVDPWPLLDLVREALPL